VYFTLLSSFALLIAGPSPVLFGVHKKFKIPDARYSTSSFQMLAIRHFLNILFIAAPHHVNYNIY